MESIKARLKRLEQRTGPRRPYPYVVTQRPGESLEDVAVRALGDLPYDPDWH